MGNATYGGGGTAWNQPQVNNEYVAHMTPPANDPNRFGDQVPKRPEDKVTDQVQQQAQPVVNSTNNFYGRTSEPIKGQDYRANMQRLSNAANRRQMMPRPAQSADKPVAPAVQTVQAPVVNSAQPISQTPPFIYADSMSPKKDDDTLNGIQSLITRAY